MQGIAMQTMQVRIVSRIVAYAEKIGLTVTHAPAYSNTGSLLFHPSATSFAVIGQVNYDFQTSYASLYLRLPGDGQHTPDERSWSYTQYNDTLEQRLQTIELAILALAKQERD